MAISIPPGATVEKLRCRATGGDSVSIAYLLLPPAANPHPRRGIRFLPLLRRRIVSKKSELSQILGFMHPMQRLIAARF